MWEAESDRSSNARSVGTELRAIHLLFACATLAACGGGGGGGSPSPGAPSPGTPPPSNPPGLTAPPSIDATRVVLFNQSVQGLPGPSTGCQDSKLVIEPTGDISAFWCESLPGSPRRLMAATFAGTGGSAATSIAVEQDFVVPNAASPSYSVSPLSVRRYLLIHELQPSTGGAQSGTRGRVVDFGGAGATPTVSAAIVLPSNVRGTTPALRDGLGAVAITDQQALPFPSIALGGGSSLTIAARTQQPLAQVGTGTFADYRAVSARGLWATFGRAASNDPLGLYVAELSLTDGTVSSPVRQSSTAYQQSNGAVGCSALPLITSTGVSKYAASWTQVSPTGAGCALMVNSRRVDANTGNVSQHAAGGLDDDLVAVWNESCGGREPRFCRLLWSRFDRVAQTWAAPQPVYAPFDRTDTAHFVPAIATGGGPAIVAGPAGNMAVVWRANIPSSSPLVEVTLVSKYVNGAWTTVSLNPGDSSFEFQQVTINAAGQGAVMFGQRIGGGAAPLSNVSVYRF